MSAARLADAYEQLHRIDAIPVSADPRDVAAGRERAIGLAQHALALAAVEQARGALLSGLSAALATAGSGAFTNSEREQIRGDIRTLAGLPREIPRD